MKLNELQTGVAYKVQGHYQAVTFESVTERYSKKRVRWSDEYYADPKGMYLKIALPELPAGQLDYRREYVHVTKIECLWSEYQADQAQRLAHSQKVNDALARKGALKKRAALALGKLLNHSVSEYSPFDDEQVLMYVARLLEDHASGVQTK